MDKSFNLRWVKHFGATSLSAGTSHDDTNGMTVDPQGNLYIVFQSYSPLFDTLITPNTYHAGVMKLSTQNGSIIWGRQFGLNSPAPVDGTKLDNHNWVYGIQYRNQSVTMFVGSESAGFVENRAGLEDIVVMRLNSETGEY